MKKANWILRAALAASFFAFGATSLSAQACSNMPYLHQNKFDPEPIELSHVQGTAVDQNGAPVARLCVGLFSTQKHELVCYAQSNAKGTFSLDTKGLPDGEYRLIGQLLGFCPANAIIDINSHSTQKKPIVVQMNLPGTDTCSTVQLGKK
ncbi:MAG: carboxypeptidase-like regulatory domain-containing protein [Candidatus Acidiferrum sp.]